jgi:hypothetical protein
MLAGHPSILLQQQLLLLLSDKLHIYTIQAAAGVV